jgi:hypothetical protein
MWNRHTIRTVKKSPFQMFAPVFDDTFIPDEIPNFATFLGDNETSISDRLVNFNNNIIVSIDRGITENQLRAIDERFGVIVDLNDGSNIDLYLTVKNFLMNDME